MTNGFEPFMLNDGGNTIYTDGRVLWIDPLMRTATVIFEGEVAGQETFTHDEYRLVYALLNSYPQHLLYDDLLSVVPGKTLEEMKAMLSRAHLKMRTLRVEISAMLETGYVLIRRYH